MNFSLKSGATPSCKYLQAAVVALCVAWAPTARAETSAAQKTPAPVEVPALVPAQSETKKSRALIVVRNTPVRVMSWWLDPQRQPLPMQMQISRQYEAMLGEFGRSTAPVSPLSAQTLENVLIERVEPQNALHVVGTDAQVREIRQAVAGLDRPLKQIEVEATFVRGDEKSLRPLLRGEALPFESAGGKTEDDPASQTQLFDAVNGWAQQLKELSSRQVTISMAPRITAIKGLVASLGTTQHEPIDDPRMAPQSKDHALFLSTRLGLAVRADWENDDHIALALRPGVERFLSLRDKKTQNAIFDAPDAVSLSLQTAPIVRFATRDGQTHALILPDSALPERETKFRITQPQLNVCFLTTRVIRRLDEKVPGT